MKVTREFVYANHLIEKFRDKKSSGWLLKDKPHFDPIGLGWRTHVLVHDILEHHEDDGDGIEFEMMAFGATFFIRDLGNWKHFQMGQGSEWVLNSDLKHFLRENKFVLPETDEEIHPDLMDRMAYVIGKSNEERDDCYGKNDLIHMAFRWISKGYRRALVRWQGNSSAQVCRLYERIVEELVNMVRSSSYSTHSEDGWCMDVTFDTVTLEHSIDFHFDDGLEHPKPISGFDYPKHINDYKKLTKELSEFVKQQRIDFILPKAPEIEQKAFEIDKKTFDEISDTYFKKYIDPTAVDQILPKIIMRVEKTRKTDDDHIPIFVDHLNIL